MGPGRGGNRGPVDNGEGEVQVGGWVGVLGDDPEVRANQEGVVGRCRGDRVVGRSGATGSLLRRQEVQQELLL